MNNGQEHLQDLIEGTNYSFEEIIDKYGNNLLFFINSIIHNLSTSEDLMEDSFVQIIIKNKTFNDESKFKAYLFKIGRNKAFNFLKRSSLVQFESFEDYGEQILDEKSFVEEIFLKGEQKKQLDNAMQKMNNEYREILHLLYFEDMSYDMAGTVMKKSKKQIDNLAYRAKKQLKAIIEKEQFYYEK